jgi:hypothetical protein
MAKPALTEPVWLEVGRADFPEAIRTLKPKGALRRDRLTTRGTLPIRQ